MIKLYRIRTDDDGWVLERKSNENEWEGIAWWPFEDRGLVQVQVRHLLEDLHRWEKPEVIRRGSAEYSVYVL